MNPRRTHKLDLWFSFHKYSGRKTGDECILTFSNMKAHAAAATVALNNSLPSEAEYSF